MCHLIGGRKLLPSVSGNMIVTQRDTSIQYIHLFIEETYYIYLSNMCEAKKVYEPSLSITGVIIFHGNNFNKTFLITIY